MLVLIGAVGWSIVGRQWVSSWGSIGISRLFISLYRSFVGWFFIGWSRLFIWWGWSTVGVHWFFIRSTICISGSTITVSRGTVRGFIRRLGAKKKVGQNSSWKKKLNSKISLCLVFSASAAWLVHFLSVWSLAWWLVAGGWWPGSSSYTSDQPSSQYYIHSHLSAYLLEMRPCPEVAHQSGHYQLWLEVPQLPSWQKL